MRDIERGDLAFSSTVADEERSTSRLWSMEHGDRVTISCRRTDRYLLFFGSPFRVLLHELFAAAQQHYGCDTVYFIADRKCTTMLAPAYDEASACTLSVLGSSGLNGHESSKSHISVVRIWNEMHQAHVMRRTLIVGVGGGVTCDITGFVASTYMRGLPYALLPTTLMAQVDAGIGGKTGFNLFGQKNLIGTFYHPIGVVIDLTTTRALADRELAAGLAEVIKVAVIGNPELFAMVAGINLDEFRTNQSLASAIIRLAIHEKLRHLRDDPMELQDLRRYLNFGHCIGHAIEAESNYTWLHGECVGAGMAIASRLGNCVGYTDTAVMSRILDTLTKLHLPVNVPDQIAPAVWAHLDRIKHVRNGELHIVVPRWIGSCISLPTWPTNVAWEEVR